MGLPPAGPSTYAVVSLVSGVGDVLGIRKAEVGRTEVAIKTRDPEWPGALIVPGWRIGGDGGGGHSASASASASGSGPPSHRLAVDVYRCHGRSRHEGRPQSLNSLDSRRTGSFSGRRPSSSGLGETQSSGDGEREEKDENENELLASAFFDLEDLLGSREGALRLPVPRSGASIRVGYEPSNSPDADEREREREREREQIRRCLLRGGGSPSRSRGEGLSPRGRRGCRRRRRTCPPTTPSMAPPASSTPLHRRLPSTTTLRGLPSALQGATRTLTSPAEATEVVEMVTVMMGSGGRRNATRTTATGAPARSSSGSVFGGGAAREAAATAAVEVGRGAERRGPPYR